MAEHTARDALGLDGDWTVDITTPLPPLPIGSPEPPRPTNSRSPDSSYFLAELLNDDATSLVDCATREDVESLRVYLVYPEAAGDAMRRASVLRAYFKQEKRKGDRQKRLLGSVSVKNRQEEPLELALYSLGTARATIKQQPYFHLSQQSDTAGDAFNLRLVLQGQDSPRSKPKKVSVGALAAAFRLFLENPGDHAKKRKAEEELERLGDAAYLYPCLPDQDFSVGALVAIVMVDERQVVVLPEHADGAHLVAWTVVPNVAGLPGYDKRLPSPYSIANAFTSNVDGPCVPVVKCGLVKVEMSPLLRLKGDTLSVAQDGTVLGTLKMKEDAGELFWLDVSASMVGISLQKAKSLLRDRIAAVRLCSHADRFVESSQSSVSPAIETLVETLLCGESVELTGVPGVGKTTLLRELAGVLADMDCCVMPPISLRGIHTLGPEELLACHFDKHTSSSIWRALRNQRVIWLLDGLDEVEQAAFHNPFIEERPEWLSLFAVARRRSHIAVAGCTTLELCNFSNEQVVRHIRSSLGDEQGNSLLYLLDSSPLHDLTSNPMLLDLICSLYKRSPDVGANVTDLFDKVSRAAVDNSVKLLRKLEKLEPVECSLFQDGQFVHILFEQYFQVCQASRSGELGPLIDRWGAVTPIASFIRSHANVFPDDKEALLECCAGAFLDSFVAVDPQWAAYTAMEKRRELSNPRVVKQSEDDDDDFLSYLNRDVPITPGLEAYSKQDRQQGFTEEDTLCHVCVEPEDEIFVTRYLARRNCEPFHFRRLIYAAVRATPVRHHLFAWSFDQIGSLSDEEKVDLVGNVFNCNKLDLAQLLKPSRRVVGGALTKIDWQFKSKAFLERLITEFLSGIHPIYLVDSMGSNLELLHHWVANFNPVAALGRLMARAVDHNDAWLFQWCLRTWRSASVLPFMQPVHISLIKLDRQNLMRLYVDAFRDQPEVLQRLAYNACTFTGRNFSPAMFQLMRSLEVPFTAKALDSIIRKTAGVHFLRAFLEVGGEPSFSLLVRSPGLAGSKEALSLLAPLMPQLMDRVLESSSCSDEIVGYLIDELHLEVTVSAFHTAVFGGRESTLQLLRSRLELSSQDLLDAACYAAQRGHFHWYEGFLEESGMEVPPSSAWRVLTGAQTRLRFEMFLPLLDLMEPKDPMAWEWEMCVQSVHSPPLQNCIDAGVCTVAATGFDHFMEQPWFHCIDCNLQATNDGRGVCAPCAQTCHQGHQVIEISADEEAVCDCHEASCSLQIDRQTILQDLAHWKAQHLPKKFLPAIVQVMGWLPAQQGIAMVDCADIAEQVLLWASPGRFKPMYLKADLLSLVLERFPDVEVTAETCVVALSLACDHQEHVPYFKAIYRRMSLDHQQVGRLLKEVFKKFGDIEWEGLRPLADVQLMVRDVMAPSPTDWLCALSDRAPAGPFLSNEDFFFYLLGECPEAFLVGCVQTDGFFDCIRKLTLYGIDPNLGLFFASPGSAHLLRSLGATDTRLCSENDSIVELAAFMKPEAAPPARRTSALLYFVAGFVAVGGFLLLKKKT